MPPQALGPPLDWTDAATLDAVSAIGPAEIKALDAYAALGSAVLRAMYAAGEYVPPEERVGA